MVDELNIKLKKILKTSNSFQFVYENLYSTKNHEILGLVMLLHNIGWYNYAKLQRNETSGAVFDCDFLLGKALAHFL